MIQFAHRLTPHHRRIALTISTFLLIIGISAAVFNQPPQVARAATSPTGRNPRIFWTSDRQAVWNQMRADYEANPNNPTTNGGKYYKILKNSADCSCKTGDGGQWATVMYQITGDTAYATKAWNMASSKLVTTPPAGGRDYTREAFIEEVWMYDWLYPSLSDSQRQQYIDRLNYLGELVTNKAAGVSWGTRIGDSDENVGHYFGVALLAAATGANSNYPNDYVNPRAEEFINTPLMGGYDASGANLSSNVRNAIAYYVQTLAKGGQWIEASDYNSGTVQLLMMGYEGMRTASGSDHYQDVAAYLPELAQGLVHEITPDLLHSYQWGDEEHPRAIWMWSRTPSLGMLAGLLQETPIGNAVNGALNDLMQTNTGIDFAATPSSQRFFYFYNPYATTNLAWRSALGNSLYSSGQGLLYTRTGWTGTDSMFAAHFPGLAKVDHSVNYFGDWQVYRNGEWAVTHPLGYTAGPEAANGMLMAGIGTAQEAKAVIAQEQASDNSYSYYAGTTAGSIVTNNYWQPPANYVHEWTRSFLHLPGSGSDVDTTIIFDRTNIEDPKQLAGWVDDGTPCASIKGRYYCDNWTRIKEATSLKAWLAHPQTMPTISGNTVTWKTCQNQTVQLTTLAPTVTQTVYNEDSSQSKDCRNNSLSGLPNTSIAGNWHENERRLQLRLAPQTTQQWDTFVNVVSVADQTTGLESSLTKSAGNEVQGAVVHRPNHSDVIALFSAKQITNQDVLSNPLQYDTQLANRIKDALTLSSGFTLTATTQTGDSQLFIANLDYHKSWSLSDNGQPVQFAISTQGLGKATLAGSGEHQLVLTAQDTAQVTITTTVDKLTAHPGDTLTYTLTYLNVGNRNATNVKITNPVPAHTTYVDQSASNGGQLTGNVLNWEVNSLAPGGSGTLTYQVTVE